MLGDDPIARLVQTLAARELRTRKSPFRSGLKLSDSLIRIIQRSKERARISRMHQDRNPKLSAGIPNRIPARIVDLDQATVCILPTQPKVLEEFQSTNAPPLDLRTQRLDGIEDKAGLVASPTRRVLKLALAPEIDVRKNRKAIGIFGPQIGRMGLELGSKRSIERHTHGDPVAIHHLDIAFEQFRIVLPLDEEMGVDIDHRKGGLFDPRLRND